MVPSKTDERNKYKLSLLMPKTAYGVELEFLVYKF